MSMLTPPGMGGKYRITGNTYPRMRRSRRRGKIAFAVIASVVAVGLVGWGSLQLIDVFSGDGKVNAGGSGADCAKPTASAEAAGASGPTPSSTSSKKRGPLPKPKQITVNVLNATSRGGLAQRTADELEKRGFKIGEVGNATARYDKKIKGPGVLLGPKTAVDTALPVLGTQLAGATQSTDARKGTEVDLIIGTGFKSLAKPADATKAMSALTHPPSPKPSPSRHC